MPIVEAAGTSASVRLPSGHEDRELSVKLEQVMVAEIEKCIAEGVTDPAVIRARKLAAKDAALAAARGE